MESTPRRTPARPYATPLSPSDSQRSREVSWASVFVTPYKAPRNPENNSQPLPVIASSATQRSAQRYCLALLVAAAIAGCFWSLVSPVIIIYLGADWWVLALTRVVIGVGGLVPSASPVRSLRTYVRRALDVRVLLWAIVLPALWLTLRSDVDPFCRVRVGLSPHTSSLAFVASTIGVLFLDAACAAVPAAVGGRDGFRLEHQLMSEYSVSVPSGMMSTLQRRMFISVEVGTLVVAPVLAGVALGAAYICPGVCHTHSSYLLPGVFAVAAAAFSLVAACVLMSGGRLSQSVVPAGATSRVVSQLSSLAALAPPAPATPPAAVEPIEAVDLSFTPGVGVRRSLNLPAVPRTPSELALVEALNSTVQTLAASRAAQVAQMMRGRLFKHRPVFTLRKHIKRTWYVQGMISRAAFLAFALVIEDAIITVGLPLLCFGLPQPHTPAPMLWAAVCTTLAVGLTRLGRHTYTACIAHLFQGSSSRRYVGIRPRDHAINGAFTASTEGGTDGAGCITPPRRAPNAPPPRSPSHDPHHHAIDVNGVSCALDASPSIPEHVQCTPDHGGSSDKVTMGPMGSCREGCVALLSAVAVGLAASLLALSQEASQRLPAVLPGQAQALLGIACFGVGVLFASACDATRWRLGQIERMRGPLVASSEWREIVDSLRTLGTLIAQPALCAALGLVDAGLALWLSAAAVALAGLLGGISVVISDSLVPTKKPDNRHMLLQGETTPETLILSEGPGSSYDGPGTSSTDETRGGRTTTGGRTTSTTTRSLEPTNMNESPNLTNMNESPNLLCDSDDSD